MSQQEIIKVCYVLKKQSITWLGRESWTENMGGNRVMEKNWMQ